MDPRPPPQAAETPSDPSTSPLVERFASAASLDPRLAWLNRPAAATHTANGLRVVPLPGADFWANTGRNPRAAATDGAFLGALFQPPFDASAAFAMHHRHDWDQAGLMVHVNADCWLKINAERVPGGGLVLATAVTNGGWTDLATFPLADTGAGGDGDPVTTRLVFRVRVADGGDVSVAYAPAGADGLAGEGGQAAARWRRVRLTHLHAATEPGTAVRVGPYALAPSRAGFIADVRWLRVEAVGGGVLDE